MSYSKRFFAAVVAFFLICLIGFICSLAGGVVWGTPSAGGASVLTAMMAVFSFAITLAVTAPDNPY